MNYLKSFLTKFWPIILIFTAVIIFFRPFIFQNKLPIPSDTIVGLYHPFRDFYAPEYPRGIPFKNFLITDPVRQQYPWRELAIDLMKKGQAPLWNPYSFSGTPLLAILQSAALYPLNFLFFLLPFNFAWSFLILLEPLMGGLFLYLYLRNLNLEKFSSFLGALSFSFSGFFVAWLEWGTILHSALWLPLILLSIDKIFHHSQSLENPKLKVKNEKLQFKIKNYLIWWIIFILALISSFFAGHLQTFFYIGLVTVAYIFARWWQYGKKIKPLLILVASCLLFIILTAIQWLPTLQFILLSGRSLDQINWQSEGWFIPWQNLVQFLAPDFFGNPSTLNYWGVWNYAEFIGYIGVGPLILALFALLWRHDKKTLFFGTLLFISLVFAFPTPLAKIPYQLQIPFLYTSQPTRLLFLTDFSLAILAALGIDYLIKLIDTKKIAIKIGSIIVILTLLFVGGWIFIFSGPGGSIPTENLAVARRNLILPTILFFTFTILLLSLTSRKLPRILILGAIVSFTLFDLLRFGEKFTPFTREEWLFSQTKTIEFLQKQEGPFRVMATDRRIFPPNFSNIYRLESVEGYDPLYLSRYAELIAASERRQPNISPPFGFNRIITPQNFESPIIDLLNVKYVLSLTDLKSPKLKKVFQEGETRVYENEKFFPRVFLAQDIKLVHGKQEAINFLFDKKIDLQKTVILEESIDMGGIEEGGTDKAEIVEYREQKIGVKTRTSGKRILVVSQNFYPGWQVRIDGQSAKTYRVDYNLLGILVPEGEHVVEFYPSL